MVGWILFFVATRKIDVIEGVRGLGLPVFVVAEEVVFVPVVHCGLQEQPADAKMPHLLEAAVGGVDAAANNSEAFSIDLLAEEVVLGEEDLLVKSAEFAEFLQIEQHEHACGEGMMKAREVLEDIVASVKQLVDETTAAAENVRCDAVKLLALSQLDGTAHDRRMREFDISVEKENVGALGLKRAQVAADRGHASADHTDVQAIAEAENDFGSAVGGVGISDQHSRTRHLRVVLIRQRSQQVRNQLRLVLGWNHDGQLARGLRAG